MGAYMGNAARAPRIATRLSDSGARDPAVSLRLSASAPASVAQGDRAEIEQAGGAQLVEAGQLVQAVEAEMHEESRGRHPE